MKNFCDWLSSNWLAVVALLVAIFGGVPGIIAVYEHYTDQPKVIMTLLRIDSGSLKWPENSKENTYVLLEFEVVNEEKSPIPLPPAPFDLSIKVDGEWIKFDKTAIPLSGTVLYSDNNDRSGANIDHMDLQKYRKLNVGRLYGNYMPSITIRKDYLESTHFLLFLNSDFKSERLAKNLHLVPKEKIPIRITWKDIRGNYHKPFLVAEKKPKITIGCYKVCSKQVRHYDF